jgi:hypothetical protein
MVKCPAPFVKESLARSSAKVTVSCGAELSNLLASINYCGTQKSLRNVEGYEKHGAYSYLVAWVLKYFTLKFVIV